LRFAESGSDFDACGRPEMTQLSPPFARQSPDPMVFSRSMAMSVSSLLGPRGCLFTFHRVAPSALWKTLPNRDFYIDLEFFDRLLTYLRRTGWTFVTIDEALRRAGRADSEDRYVNFSVDDGYRDTYELVVPLFRRHGVPITIYVTTGIPDGTIPLWWAGLEETLLRRDRVVVDHHAIDVGTASAKRRAYVRIERAWSAATNGYDAFCAQNDIDSEALHWRHAISWQMLAELRDDPLVEIGSHGACIPASRPWSQVPPSRNSKTAANASCRRSASKPVTLRFPMAAPAIAVRAISSSRVAWAFPAPRRRARASSGGGRMHSSCHAIR
jgi:peptidoglycan/xylan/chitin deacetylase (PgdA/CDA1 family)